MRVISLGLLVAVPLLLFGWGTFIQWMIVVAPHYEVPLPSGALSAITVDEAGAAMLLPATFIIGCLGVGFAVSELFWGVLGMMGFAVSSAVSVAHARQGEGSTTLRRYS